MAGTEKERILIIDGDVEVRCILCDHLWKDYDIDIVESLADAVNVVKNKSYSVVMLPIDALGIKNVEVVRQLREAKSDTPMIVITTHSSVPLAVEAMKAGAYGYITKPFNFDELKLVILHASEWHKLMGEAKEKQIFQEMALVDSLTHIYNRRYFDELLDREVKRALRYPQKFSLLLIDLDDFKHYNDTYGHVAGDNVLSALGKFLISISRNTDFLARYGGEEFAIITPQTDKNAASFLATRIVLLVANTAFGEASKGQITMSMGVATFGDDAKTKEDLIKCADKALYQAKKLGKNKVCLFSSR